MIDTRPYIVYSLPKSRTTQALNGGKIEKVWKNLQHFLTTCTTANINDPVSIEMVGYSADEEHGEAPELAGNILKITGNIFGPGKTEPVSFLYPENIPSKQTRTEWSLRSNDLARAIDFLVAGQPYPRYNLGPLALIISYDFRLRDAVKTDELPNQQQGSSILIWLTRNCCISPILTFPFTEPNEDFWKYIDWISEFFPFKFDAKHLRSCRVNKKGTSIIFSKL